MAIEEERKKQTEAFVETQVFVTQNNMYLKDRTFES